jgi:branched-chain amino acid aminotransferase
MLVFFNNQILATHEISQVNNRAFRYGDGLFESMRIMNGELLFFHDHIQRLFAGMNALKIKIPEGWDLNYFYHLVCELMERNQITTSGRIRLQVWREGSGRYTPESNEPDLMIELMPMEDNEFTWLSTGLSIDVAISVKKAYDVTANIKTCSSLTYILASIEAKEKNIDETIIENAYGKIADTCTGNLFLISKGKVITPTLRDAPVAGVFRSNLIEMLRHEKFAVAEESITVEDILTADEIFITNATKGIRPVTRFRNKNYSSGFTKLIFERFNEFLASVEQ